MSVEEVSHRIRQLLLRHPSVRRSEVTGSRALGDPTPLSDLDIHVEVDDFESLVQDLPALMSDLQPLGQQWDRLSERWNYMLMLRGPLKVDLIFDEPYSQEPPWVPSADNLAALDHHFWDWSLWLGSKTLRGDRALVDAELAKMFVHLLQPLGVAEQPTDLGEAVDMYVSARDRAARSMGASVSRQIESEVLAGLRRAALIPDRTGSHR